MSTKSNKSAAFTKEEVAQLFETLDKYRFVREDVDGELALKGKELGVAQREHASRAYYWGARKAEISVIVKRLEAKVAAIRGRLVRWYKDNDAINSSERQIEKYVDAHDEFLTANEVLLEAEELYRQYLEIEAAFEKRGFIIRDHTNSRIHEVHRDVI